MDSIGDFLTIIRNGVRNSKPFVIAPYSKLRHAIAGILKDEGFIRNVVVLQEPNSVKKNLQVFFNFVDGESVIHEIDRVSKPSKRVYVGADNIKPVIGKLGLSILSTNQGVISHKKAQKLGVGGEVICTVW